MHQDIYCPFCRQDFDDEGNDNGYCPVCGMQWHRYMQYYEEIGDSCYEIEWETQDL